MRFGWAHVFAVLGWASLLALVLWLAPKWLQRAKETATLTVKPAPAPPYAPRDTTLLLGRHAVDLRYPKGILRGCLLVLPGWNFARTRWCQETALCRKALAQGYAVVLPEMGKSLYTNAIFAETSPDLRAAPSLAWVTDSLLPLLAKVRLAGEGHFLAAVGLSTGARGAFRLALEQPQWVQAAVCLSGDYRPLLNPADKLYAALWGPSAQFPDRWGGPEDLLARAAGLRRPVYVAHGMKDAVVPASQSLQLAEALRKRNGGALTETHFPPEAGHDFAYWNSEVDWSLRFLQAAAADVDRNAQP